MLPGANPLRVLLVEDQADLRQLMALILRHADYQVDAVASAAEALTRLAVHNYEVVISDLRLGIPMNGVQLAETIRNGWPRSRFILVTGCATAPSDADARLHGIDEVLIKPFSSGELRGAVQQVLLMSGQAAAK